jgi:hypothetical protein
MDQTLQHLSLSINMLCKYYLVRNNVKIYSSVFFYSKGVDCVANNVIVINTISEIVFSVSL